MSYFTKLSKFAMQQNITRSRSYHDGVYRFRLIVHRCAFFKLFVNHLASGDSAKFAMNPVTAAVYLKEPLDFETTQTHTITVQVADQGITPQKMSTATLTINVLNTNDNKPVS